MQAPGNSYGSKSFQTGPGHSQIFKALLKIGFHSPVSFSIQFSFCTAPHPHYFSFSWNASHHCFLSTPLTRSVIYCTSAFCKPLPATKRTEPFMFCLAPEGKKQHIKRTPQQLTSHCRRGARLKEAVAILTQHTSARWSGSIGLMHRRHLGSLTDGGYLGIRAFWSKDSSVVAYRGDNFNS